MNNINEIVKNIGNSLAHWIIQNSDINTVITNWVSKLQRYELDEKFPICYCYFDQNLKIDKSTNTNNSKFFNFIVNIATILSDDNSTLAEARNIISDIKYAIENSKTILGNKGRIDIYNMSNFGYGFIGMWLGEFELFLDNEQYEYIHTANPMITLDFLNLIKQFNPDQYPIQELISCKILVNLDKNATNLLY